MAQIHKPKPPLDVLQSMVNGILIEVGKALRNSEKDSGRTFASANNRLKSTVPSTVDNFHQALDDLEVEILQAKAVVLRDLNEKRAQRLARENPIDIPEPPAAKEIPAVPIRVEQPNAIVNSAPVAEKEPSPLPPQPIEPLQPTHALSITPNPPTDQGIHAAQEQTQQPQQDSTPPNITPPQNTRPVGLGINTEGIIPPNATVTTPAPDTALTAPQSSVNSLFDDNEGDSHDDLFGSLDFSQSQTLNFETTNTTQNFEVDANKELSDFFDMGDATSGGATVGDLDLTMAGNSTFDDMIWEDGDGDGSAGIADLDDFFDTK